MGHGSWVSSHTPSATSKYDDWLCVAVYSIEKSFTVCLSGDTLTCSCQNISTYSVQCMPAGLTQQLLAETTHPFMLSLADEHLAQLSWRLVGQIGASR